MSKRAENLKYYYKQATKPIALIALLLGFVGVLLGAAGLFLAVRYHQLNQNLIVQLEQNVQPVRLVAEGDVTSPLEPETVYPLTYQVKSGDSLWKIAERFYGHGCDYNRIVTANALQNPNQLEIGDELVIPAPPQEKKVIGLNDQRSLKKANKENNQTYNSVKTNDRDYPASGEQRENSEQHFEYQVEAGDSLWFIALKYYDDGARWPEIYQHNMEVIGSNPNLIFPGTKLDL